MSTTTRRHVTRDTMARAQRLAAEAAARYFAALAADIPYDVAPGEVNLIDACVSIQRAIIERADTSVNGYEEQASMQAGYLLGVEIGRRMGGAR